MNSVRRAGVVAATALAAASAVALYSSGTLTASNPTEAVVSISPANIAAEPGEPLLIEVMVSGVTDKSLYHPDEPGGLGAFEFTLPFEPTIMAFQDVSVGPFLASTGRQVTCLPPMLEPNSVRFGCVSEGLAGAPSGDGVLARLRFAIFCPAEADLNFTNVNLAEPFGKAIPAAAEGAQLSCPAPPVTQTPTSTRTPTPTRTPTVPSKALGDVNDDLEVDSVDALLILQLEAGLITSLINPESADLNDDELIDPVDAALILQCEAGLIGICH